MTKFKFSVGPWNVHSGADSYGPATRKEIDFEEKLKMMQCRTSMIIRKKKSKKKQEI